MRWPWSGDAPAGDSQFAPSHSHDAASAQSLWVTAGFVVVSGCALAAALFYLRGEAIRSGEQLSESLVHVIEEQTSRTFQAVDQRLQLAAVNLADLDKQGRLTQDAARAMLRAQLAELAFVRAMWVLDAQGRIVFDSDVGNIGMSLADREYFQVYGRQPAAGFYLSAPVRSRSVGTWLISASRPLRAPDGSLTGVIVAAVDPPYFDQLWSHVHARSGGAVALLRRDTTLMLRSPLVDAAMGQRLPASELFTAHLPRQSQGSYQTTGAVVPGVRFVSYRVLAAYPDLVIAIGRTHADVLGPWGRFAALSALAWLAAVAIAVLMGLLRRRHSGQYRRAGARFGQLAQAMPQIVFIATSRGRLAFVNDQWTQTTGQPVEVALTAGWVGQVHPDDRDRATQEMRHMLDTGENPHREYRLQCRDGTYRWHLLRAVPTTGATGRITAWYGTLTDIDELKRAEIALVAQTELLRLAGHMATLGGWKLDLATGEFTWTDEANALLGLPASSAPTLESAIAQCAPPWREMATRLARQCLQEGTPFDVELEMLAAGGRLVWVRSIGQAMRDGKGAIVGMRGAIQDITRIKELSSSLEQKVAQRTGELARQEALFRTLAEQAPQPIWTTDRRGSVTFLSRAFYDLVGGAPPDWHGDAWIELVHPDDRPEMVRNWLHASRVTRRLYTGMRRIRDRSGAYRTTSYRVAPVLDAQGEVTFWVGVDADVTEIKAAETALRLANEELKTFSYSVSHDLRAPLAAVDGFSRALESTLSAQDDPKVRHYLARIRDNVGHMDQLIEGLLALAELSQVQLAPARVDLSAIAAGILERHVAQGSLRPGAFQVEDALVVHADPRLMRSVMENLLGNACKFSARSPQPRIEVGWSPGHEAYFVRDNGAGFDMAYAGKLFAPFQRLHAASEFAGTGIGLATVSRVIARHGGRIWAESSIGKGATFYFTLPAVNADVQRLDGSG